MVNLAWKTAKLVTQASPKMTTFAPDIANFAPKVINLAQLTTNLMPRIADLALQMTKLIAKPTNIEYDRHFQEKYNTSDINQMVKTNTTVLQCNKPTFVDEIL